MLKKKHIRKTKGNQQTQPDEVWEKLNLSWTAFFAALGFINLFVAFVLFKSDFSSWVSFKAFGTTGLTFVFIIGQTIYLAKYMKDEA
jgi:intracellular septation protein